jgi:riboflavin synthase
MFTGLVETTGTVIAARRREGEVRLRIAAPFAASLGHGKSVAVDGVCLTVTARGRGWFEAEVSPQTLSCTTLGLRAAGDRVNLERPVRLGDPLGGHLVQGHVDGVGVVESIVPEGGGARARIAFPPALGATIVARGSIAVDGVSLTVAARAARWFEVALVPATLRVTHLGSSAPGTPVNLEVDLLGRYIVELLRQRHDGPDGTAPAVTREHLARHGFGGRSGGAA